MTGPGGDAYAGLSACAGGVGEGEGQRSPVRPGGGPDSRETARYAAEIPGREPWGAAGAGVGKVPGASRSELRGGGSYGGGDTYAAAPYGWCSCGARPNGRDA